MQTNKANRIRTLIGATKGRFFAVEFHKKDGTLRHMTARTGVQKHVKGVGMHHDPSSLGHLIVWDTVKKAYRTVDSHKVTFFKSGTTTWGRSAHD